MSLTPFPTGITLQRGSTLFTPGTDLKMERLSCKFGEKTSLILVKGLGVPLVQRQSQLLSLTLIT